MPRYLFQGSIILQTPMHLGSGQANRLSDSPIRTGVNGLPVVPGTSLGGVLRAQAERLAPAMNLRGGVRCNGPDAVEPCDCLVCQVFGAIKPENENDRVCRLVIRDATLQNIETPIEIRDGTGISRRTRTVAQNLKFDWEVLARGAKFEFEASLETGGPEAPAHLQLFCAALSEMVAGRVFLGGRSGRGMGRCRLELSRIGEFNPTLTGMPELKKFLKTPVPRRVELSQAGPNPSSFVTGQLIELGQSIRENLPIGQPPNFIELEVRLHFDYGLLINNPAQAILHAGDNAFVRTAYNASGQPTLYLPGSGLRGMLRSHAERIARTLSYERASDATGYNYNRYVDFIGACDPVAVPRPNRPQLEPTGEEYAGIACTHYLQKDPDRTYSLADLEQYSCLACRLFGNEYLAGRLKISDAFPTENRRLDPESPNTRHRMDFVAIDRFTGGARDSAKFEANPHFSGSQRQNKLSFSFTLSLQDLRLEGSDPENDSWMIGWLAYLLRDLSQGDMYLGYGRAKGFGKVRSSLTRLTLGSLKADPNWFTHFLPSFEAGWTTRPERSGLFQVYTLDLNGPQLNYEQEQALLTEYARAFDNAINNYRRVRANLEPEVTR